MSRPFPSILALAQERQHKRLLRLSFPRNDGPEAVLLANRLDADEGLSRDFTFAVEVLADNPGIALKDVLGKMVAIELVRGDGSLRYFTGFVFEFSLSKFDGAIALYKLVLKPWLAYLALRKDNFIFHGQTLREQTDSIFSDYGQHANWDCKIRGADAAMTMATQFDETDHNYLHRRRAQLAALCGAIGAAYGRQGHRAICARRRHPEHRQQGQAHLAGAAQRD